jgi:hypothetical protein
MRTAVGNYRRLRPFAGCLLLVLGVTGCARQDWIGSTLVTADVSGTWSGLVARPPVQHRIELVLDQRGSRVTGTITFRGSAFPIDGSVSGDVFRFRSPNRSLTAELTVGIDEMAGWLTSPTQYVDGRYTVTLKRL